MTTPTAPLSLEVANLDDWLNRGILSPLDVEVAGLMSRSSPSDDPLVALTAALVSRATQAGHVCLDLARRDSFTFADGTGQEIAVSLPDRDTWRTVLGDSKLVGDGTQPTPLVLVEQRVYLHRYFDYERRLLANIKSRLAQSRLPLEPGQQELLSTLFANSPSGDLQKRAALLAAVNRFCVISGGPGTGKTTTVAKVLALLATRLDAHRVPLRLLLLAPTGKAASRLAESLSAGLEALPIDERLRRSLSTAPSTIHRALGYQPRTPTKFRHDAHQQLTANVVVVDEAAMVDLSLMTKLCEAVPQSSHLILLGDRDQLASVEAGAVFGDLFNAKSTLAYSPQLAQQIRDATGEVVASSTETTPRPIADCTIHLDKSYRYSAHGGIAKLARAVRAGEVETAMAILGAPDVHWIRLAEDGAWDEAAEEEVRGCIRTGFGPLRKARTPEDRLAALASFRLLSPHRRGPFGVQGLNDLAERTCLTSELRFREGAYAGQPILVHENDYQSELYNGDVGIVDVGRGGKLCAYFPDNSKLRQLSLARLPAHSTVYAMTIHKSQGSEFDRVVVVLPHHASPLLSRELLYTAITRARSHVTLVASRSSIRASIERRIERSSGLRAALWGT